MNKEKAFAETVKPSFEGHVLIAAPTGGGKSYFVGALIEQLYKNNHPFVILDTKSQNHIGLWLGSNRLKKLKLYSIAPGVTLDVADYKKMVSNFPYLLCVPQPDADLDEVIEEYKKILQALKILKIPRHVIVEETHHYTTSPQKAIPEINWMIREGRGARVWLWSITQRIQSFPKDVWSNGMWTYVMKMRIPHDIAYFKDILPGFDKINDELEQYDVLQYDQLGKMKPNYRIIKASDVVRKTKHLG